MSMWLTQADADALLALEKHRVDEERRRLPDLGGGIVVPLVSHDESESFHLDITRSRINLNKGTFQNRARTTIILARLDFGGAPHRNPDDEEIGCPHIHLYQEGYNDRWAYPIPTDQFPSIADPFQSLQDFLRYCNVTRPPHFEPGLFT
ncbi:MAG: hypothetical protein COA65_01270 [Rhodospirillaceae bacterium]|nr:MAG: hypothetical protein COA65_01270 [Rhodospirillaceae bacterium]